MGRSGTVIAVDVGGSSMKGWVCARDGAQLRQLARPTPVSAGPAEVVRAVRRLVTELRDGFDDVRAAAVVVPGLVDPVAGIATYATNLGWRDVPLRQLINDDLGVPVALDHDVRAGGLAEARLGASMGVAHSLFVPVGTGIAAALIVDGAIYAGAAGAAGELGHLIVAPDGEPCACGQRGCVETYASASAISRRFHARTGELLTAAEVAGRLAADPAAREVWADAVGALALGLAACTMLFDPELIVLGGGLATSGDALTRPLVAALAARLAWREPPAIVAARLGREAGRFGAAILAWQAAGEADVPLGWPALPRPGAAGVVP